MNTSHRNNSFLLLLGIEPMNPFYGCMHLKSGSHTWNRTTVTQLSVAGSAIELYDYFIKLAEVTRVELANLFLHRDRMAAPPLCPHFQNYVVNVSGIYFQKYLFVYDN